MDRIKAFAPQRIDVVHPPEPLATPRHIADHHGNPRALNKEDRARRAGYLAQPDVSFDIDFSDAAGMPKKTRRD